MAKLTIDGITIEKTKKGFQLIIPTSANELTIKEWRAKNDRKIKQFKKANQDGPTNSRK